MSRRVAFVCHAELSWDNLWRTARALARSQLSEGYIRLSLDPRRPPATMFATDNRPASYTAGFIAEQLSPSDAADPNSPPLVQADDVLADVAQKEKELAEARRQAEEYQKAGLAYSKMINELRGAKEKLTHYTEMVEEEMTMKGFAYKHLCSTYTDFIEASKTLEGLREKYDT